MNVRATPGSSILGFMLIVLLIMFCINKYIHTGTHKRIASARDITISRYFRLLKDGKFNATRQYWLESGDGDRVEAAAKILSRLEDIHLANEYFHDGSDSYSSGSTNVVLRVKGAKEWETDPVELQIILNSEDKDYRDSRASGYFRQYRVEFSDSEITMSVSFGEKRFSKKAYIRGISLSGDFEPMSELLDGIKHDFKVREIRRGSTEEGKEL